MLQVYLTYQNNQWKMNTSTKFSNILISEKAKNRGLKYIAFLFSGVVIKRSHSFLFKLPWLILLCCLINLAVINRVISIKYVMYKVFYGECLWE